MMCLKATVTNAGVLFCEFCGSSPIWDHPCPANALPFQQGKNCTIFSFFQSSSCSIDRASSFFAGAISAEWKDEVKEKVREAMEPLSQKFGTAFSTILPMIRNISLKDQQDLFYQLDETPLFEII